VVAPDRSFARLWNRWTFEGTLACATALHVGGGEPRNLASDSPIVRDAVGRPFLPGSTLKGALRAAVDRLVPAVGSSRGLTCCGLSPQEERCPSPPGSPAREAVERALREFAGTPREREQQLLRLLEERLCASCRLFGSPWLAGRVYFADAFPLEPGELPIEIRDGVGIDRDSGTAREQLRYSYEALPATTRFAFRLEAENLDDADEALLALALSELRRGAIRLGGGASRGLGACHLELQQVRSIRFTPEAAPALRAYLRDGTMETHAADDWLERATRWLWGG
jgi:CRISPR-associated RAMP protein (TIGR02581 family)